MIKFRQKNFFWPALLAKVGTGTLLSAGVMGGTTALSMKQASKQAKEQEQQNAKTQKLIAAQNKKLDKLAEAAKSNPEVAGEAADVLKEKEMSAIDAKSLSALGKTIYQAGKGAFGQGMKDNVIMGTAMGGSVLLGGKLIHHNMKKNNLEVGNDGNLQQIQPKTYSALAGISSAASKIGKFAANNKNNLLMGSAFGGVPLVLGYASDKQKMKAQEQATMEQQREFAFINAQMLKGIGKSVSKGWETLKSHPAQSISGGINKFGSFGIGGTKNVQRFGEKLILGGIKNNSNAAVKAGEWIKAHPTGANVLTAVPLIGAAKLTWDGSEKAVGAVGKKIDPNAYKYKDAKDAAVQ